MRVGWDPNMLAVSKAESLADKKSTSQKALQEAAEQFEALFIYQLLTEMRKTVPEADLLGDRKGEKLFQSLLDQEIADHSARNQSLGLAKLIYEQMSRFVPDDD
ncbi:MAG: flagellar biosynthesis protein FlgJ [Firmicutes bacterium]|jgi:flagellar protein FlgJ|nr:flagellar biosynthesis protein FlgJ [Bacillota bacterium]